MNGAIAGTAGELPFSFERQSLFDESASCVHVAAGTTVRITATTTRVDRLRMRQPPPVRAARVYARAGRGRAARSRPGRQARTAPLRAIADRSNSPPEVELVLGRSRRFRAAGPAIRRTIIRSTRSITTFTEPQGYGMELGEPVVKVRQADTVKIPAGLDHAQCAAPGWDVLLVGDPASAGQALHRARVHRRARVDDAARRAVLAAARLRQQRRIEEVKSRACSI